MPDSDTQLDSTDTVATRQLSEETRLDRPGHRRSTEEPTVAPGTSVGRYLVLGCIGVGGMGMVYSAYDPQLDRKVALKLLRPRQASADSTSETGSARLLRESQVMAKITHPNVVTVYDVGLHEGRVFMAMEFIAGRALGKWLQGEDGAGWRRVVDVFVQAGKGLASLHAAGLVHRDFKPLNVIVGDDGRVCVLDFGLARRTESLAADIESEAATTELTEAEERIVGAEGADAITELDPTLTHAGSIVGTPRYMAPEQFLLKPMDNRTDQFSFAMAMYEGLYHQHPFRDGHGRDYRAAVLQGDLRPPPRDSVVPARFHRILVRALQPELADRYPSLDELLAELGQARHKGRRGLVLTAAATVGLLLIGWIALRQNDAAATRCQDSHARWTDVWDEPRKQAMATAFRSTSAPYVETALQSTATLLDEYVNAWAAIHRQTCEATLVRHEQSRELMDRRMLCLETRLEETRALIEVFQHADADLVLRAVDATSSLTALGPCSKLDLLAASNRQPDDPQTRETVRRLRLQLGRARGLQRAGRYPQAATLASQTADAALAVDYLPVRALALFALGELQNNAVESETSLLAAYQIADKVGDDSLRAYVAANLVYAVGFQQARYAEARLWAQVAGAALERAGRNDDLRATLHLHMAASLSKQGNHEQALQESERALELLTVLHGPHHADVAAALNNKGLLLGTLERWDEALVIHQQSMELSLALHGPAHPDVAMSHNNLAVLFNATGRNQESRYHLEAARRIWEEALGISHPDVAYALANLGEWHEDADQLDQARSYYQEAQKIWEAALGPDDPEVAFALTGLGRVTHLQGHSADAVPLIERALTIRLTAKMDPLDLAQTQFALACALRGARQQAPRARALAERAASALREGGESAEDLLAEVEAWLHERP